MKTPAPNFRSIDLDVSFFSFLIRKLKPMPVKKITQTLHFVLTSLLKNQPAKKINRLIKRLPPSLQLVFVGCWQPGLAKIQPVVHLDELVENFYQHRDSNMNPLFSSRVEVLASVLIIIKALKNLSEVIDIKLLPYSIELEYQQAAIEDAA